MAFNDQPSGDGSCTVFVGNISYNATEGQMRDTLQQAGNVVNFRLIMDRQTGRPKGFGFCEFDSPQSAATAIQSLNGLDVNGRQIRVAPANNQSGQGGGQGGGQGHGGHGGHSYGQGHGHGGYGQRQQRY